eukprot:13509601-Alexandrium_andersonii.AAC.1
MTPTSARSRRKASEFETHILTHRPPQATSDDPPTGNKGPSKHPATRTVQGRSVERSLTHGDHHAPRCS